MDPVTVGIIGTVGVFGLLFLGMHIAFALMLVGFIGHQLSGFLPGRPAGGGPRNL